MMGRAQSKSVSRSGWNPIPWTKITPVVGGAFSIGVGWSMSAQTNDHRSRSCLDPRASVYHAVMYLDALSFLEDERDAWRPYEALVELSDDDLVRPVADARGWSGRDLIIHMIAWQLVALDVAKELAVSPESPTKAQADADWEARGGEVVNAEIEAKWADRPIDEIRNEFLRISGELRGFLTVVPETRWLKNADYQRFFIDETLDHYEDHRADLAAILSAAGR